jgi:hypothetical protein
MLQYFRALFFQLVRLRHIFLRLCECFLDFLPYAQYVSGQIVSRILLHSDQTLSVSLEYDFH